MIQQNFKPFCLEVWGDYACFTRPEMKVERVSYDVPTPSAVRAIFEAIFWKPAIRWQVNKIEVLKPIKTISIRRNEVDKVMSERSDGIFIEESRQQRAGLCLRDVHYRFYATMEYIPPEKRPDKKKSNLQHTLFEQNISEKSEAMDENPGKYLAMFERRAKKGQCFYQPYLGCREFSCYFRLVENPEEETIKPIPETRDLGFMLYDLDFTNPKDPQPMFFRARLENGVVHVPPRDSKEVLR